MAIKQKRLAAKIPSSVQGIRGKTPGSRPTPAGVKPSIKKPVKKPVKK